MRKLIAGIILGLALLCGTKAHAQYNREYFFWVGRSCMMNNDYQEAIRTLNTLLRFDEDAFEGYFLRGIAKYNLDDLLGAEDDFFFDGHPPQSRLHAGLHLPRHHALAPGQLRRRFAGFP